MSNDKSPFQENTKGADFRIVFANAFGIQFNGHDLVLRCGILRDLTKPDGGIDEQVAIAMTAVSMKSLATNLTVLVEHYEKTTGQQIPLAPTAKIVMEKAIADSAARNKKP